MWIYVCKKKKVGEDLEGEKEARDKQTLDRKTVMATFTVCQRKWKSEECCSHSSRNGGPFQFQAGN